LGFNNYDCDTPKPGEPKTEEQKSYLSGPVWAVGANGNMGEIGQEMSGNAFFYHYLSLGAEGAFGWNFANELEMTALALNASYNKTFSTSGDDSVNNGERTGHDIGAGLSLALGNKTERAKWAFVISGLYNLQMSSDKQQTNPRLGLDMSQTNHAIKGDLDAKVLFDVSSAVALGLNVEAVWNQYLVSKQSVDMTYAGITDEVSNQNRGMSSEGKVGAGPSLGYKDMLILNAIVGAVKARNALPDAYLTGTNSAVSWYTGLNGSGAFSENWGYDFNAEGTYGDKVKRLDVELGLNYKDIRVAPFVYSENTRMGGAHRTDFAGGLKFQHNHDLLGGRRDMSNRYLRKSNKK